MGESTSHPELTPQELHLIALLRQGPQSVDGLAQLLHLSPELTRCVLESLDRKVGIVLLFRAGTLQYGLAE